MINYCMLNDKVQWDYVKAFTNAAFLVKDGFAYHDGLFTGYDENKRDYDKSSWDYVIGEDGYAVVDETMRTRVASGNFCKTHVSIYTPDSCRAHLRNAQRKVPEDRGDDRGYALRLSRP